MALRFKQTDIALFGELLFHFPRKSVSEVPAPAKRPRLLPPVFQLVGFPFPVNYPLHLANGLGCRPLTFPTSPAYCRRQFPFGK